jgi:fused signal recognition particle receptor
VFRRLFRSEEKSAGGQKIQQSLSKTRQGVFGRIGSLFQANEITDELWDELEALLIQADVGIDTTLKLVEAVRTRVTREGIKRAADAYTVLKREMVALFGDAPPMAIDEPRLLTVVLVVGVNGSGKTTTIAKLAHYYKQRGRRVVLAAADTFRAAAIDQLKIWGERAGVEVIAQGPGADPGAVVYDAIRASQESRKADLLIIDTAGRLHTKFNLMKELEKIRNVAARQVHRAPHETFLVLDATTGQNALSQARHFKDSVKITGVILTKLDGTAKGGVVLAIRQELGVPVRFVGTGEGLDDLVEFDPVAFVDGLFEDTQG